jgi:hypothetical protein
MRILYVAGNRYGAGLQAKRIIDNLEGHTIKVAAFLKSSYFIDNVDWVLDALYVPQKRSKIGNLLAYKLKRGIDKNILETLMSDISIFEPELVICDDEYVVANIAKTFKYPLWYCSPVPSYLGMSIGSVDFKYEANMRKYIIDFQCAPPADRILMYSPYGDYFRDMPRSSVEHKMPKAKVGFEWVSPYFVKESDTEEIKSDTLMVINNISRFSSISKIANYSDKKIIISSLFNNQFPGIESFSIKDIGSYKKLIKGAGKIFTTGDTATVCDAFYNGKSMVISPDLTDPESMINSYMIKRFYFGVDIGQFEFTEKYALGILDNAIDKNKYTFFSKRKYKEVHQLI